MCRDCQEYVHVYHVQTMYNISQAAARAGVTVPVLRAWERRYGIVRPARTPNGYRRFDDEAIDRVRSMRALVDDGWSPSAAAAAILSGRAAASASDAAAPAMAAGRTVEAPGAATEAAALSTALVAGARALAPQAVATVLDDLFARGSFERVASDLLFPALEALGDAWARGEVSVAGEHMASHAVQRRLAQAFEAAGGLDPQDGKVVVGLPPGARHELGALAFAVAARRAGLGVTYLGADLPAAEWVAAAERAEAAVIGVVSPRDRKPALEVARLLLETRPSLVVAVGGRSAMSSPGVLPLPDRLSDAVAAIKRALAP